MKARIASTFHLPPNKDGKTFDGISQDGSCECGCKDFFGSRITHQFECVQCNKTYDFSEYFPERTEKEKEQGQKRLKEFFGVYDKITSMIGGSYSKF